MLDKFFRLYPRFCDFFFAWASLTIFGLVAILSYMT